MLSTEQNPLGQYKTGTGAVIAETLWGQERPGEMEPSDWVYGLTAKCPPNSCALGMALLEAGWIIVVLESWVDSSTHHELRG